MNKKMNREGNIDFNLKLLRFKNKLKSILSKNIRNNKLKVKGRTKIYKKRIINLLENRKKERAIKVQE